MELFLNYLSTNTILIFEKLIYLSSSQLSIYFLLPNILIAFFVFKKYHQSSTTSFKNFLLPSHTYPSPSALLDLKFFFVNHILFRFVLQTSFFSIIFIYVSNNLFLFLNSHFPIDTNATTVLTPSFLAITYLLYVLLTDITLYFSHLAQHKSKILWEFHKIHHSPPQLTPLSAFRFHPVDDILTFSMQGLVAGAFTGIFFAIFNILPQTETYAGFALAALSYNIIGFHLRHSHIWIVWPGMFKKIFGSPGFHQVHHSHHPDHIDKNFGVKFAIWDVIFKTYIVPETNKDLKIGLSPSSVPIKYTSLFKLYTTPFKNLIFPSTDKPNSKIK